MRKKYEIMNEHGRSTCKTRVLNRIVETINIGLRLLNFMSWQNHEKDQEIRKKLFMQADNVTAEHSKNHLICRRLL